MPALTFAATANAAVFCGATPVFADVDPDTLLLDPADAAARVTPRTRAIAAVDYAGQPCDYHALRALADRHGLALLDDACHALGGAFQGRPVGSLADLSTFSLHPVKPITTGEGGMITTDDAELARRMRLFRNHGITTDHRQREALGSWFYEMTELGFNYRLTDFQSALGIRQLRKIARLGAAPPGDRPPLRRRLRGDARRPAAGRPPGRFPRLPPVRHPVGSGTTAGGPGAGVRRPARREHRRQRALHPRPPAPVLPGALRDGAGPVSRSPRPPTSASCPCPSSPP